MVWSSPIGWNTRGWGWAAPVSSFDPDTLFPGSEVGAWWDLSDISTLWQDSARTTPVTADSDPLGCVDDKSGNGNHLLQATAGNRPLYKTSGGFHWAEGNGVDQWMRATFTLAVPYDRVSAIRQIAWTLNDIIYDGATGAGGRLQQQGGSSPNLRIISGGTGVINTELSIAANGVVTERFKASSLGSIAVNNGAYVDGTTGATLPGGVTLFASSSATAPGNARFYCGVIRESLTDQNITDLRGWAAARGSITL